MTWPIPWVILISPQIDNPDATPGGRTGIIPANSADPLSILFPAEGGPSNQINQFAYAQQCLRPLCIAPPWAYDDAGVAFPAGSLVVFAGLKATMGLGTGGSGNFGYLRGSGGTGTLSLEVPKHLFPLRIRIWGLPLATTGTVIVGHKADYGSGAIAVTDATFTFDGADGPDQVAILDAPISAPAAPSVIGGAVPGTVFFTIQDNWTGTAPATAVADYNHMAIRQARIVPAAIPVDFTARDDADQDRGGCWDTVDRGYAAYLRLRASAVHPSNRRFIIEDSLTSGSPVAFGRGIGLTPSASRRMGSADSYDEGSPGSSNSFGDNLTNFPHLWIGDDLWSAGYMSRALGVTVRASAAKNYTDTYNTAGAHTYTEPNTFATTWGPGWRNVRVTLQTAFNVTGARLITINDITANIYLDGVFFGSSVYTGPFTVGSTFDFVNALPATRLMFSKIEVKFEIHSTAGAAGGGVSGTFSGSMFVQFSPRCDIPLPFTAVGPANEVAPGGYLASALSNPLANGEPAVHGGVVDTVINFANPGNTRRCSFAGTFLPATTGVWKIVSSNGGSLTLGEFEFRHFARSSQIGRAGKRFWGHEVSAVSGTSSWTLTAVTQVQTAVPGSGLTINSGHLTDGHWFFGTLALPAAGTYRVTAPCAAGSGLLLAASQTDPYVADHLDGVHAIIDGAASGSPLSITLDITVAAAATVYLRFGKYDPYHRSTSDSPLSGGATGLISWAAV